MMKGGQLSNPNSNPNFTTTKPETVLPRLEKCVFHCKIGVFIGSGVFIIGVFRGNAL